MGVRSREEFKKQITNMLDKPNGLSMAELSKRLKVLPREIIELRMAVLTLINRGEVSFSNTGVLSLVDPTTRC